MKRYKLIKEYPGSPKLGTIVELKNDGFYPINAPGGWFSEEYHLNPFPEFWEEVVEKDYEILSYKSLKEGHILFYNEKYDKNFFNNDNWIIHSVKRLSDGEVFTIGDICKTTKSEHTLLIDEIVIIDNVLRFNCGNVKGVHCTLNNDIYKVKQPLFTTEDGVDIYEGDSYYPVCNYYNIHNKCIYPSGHKMFKLFSSKEAAEEYILMNKPCLSIQEVLNNYTYDKDVKLSIKDTTNNLKSIVKSRL